MSEIEGRPTPTMKIHHHADRGAFDRAVGLAYGSQDHGLETHLWEGMTQRGKEAHVWSRMRLGTVSFPGTSTNGLHAVMGPVPLSPEGLGGIFQQLSDVYEQSLLKRVIAEYRPSIPATSSGSVGIAFSEDVGERMDFTGEAAAFKAASHEQFVETQSWLPADLDVVPDPAYQRYWDAETGDFRTSAAGLLRVVSMSICDPASVGNLDVIVEMCFLSLAFDRAVLACPTSTCTISSGSDLNTGSLRAIIANNDGADLSVPLILSLPSVPDGSALENFVWSAVPSAVSANWASFNFRTMESSDVIHLAPGQAFFIRFLPNTTHTAKYNMFVFTNLEAASSVLEFDIVEGQLIWADSASVGDDTNIVIQLRGMAIAAQ